MLQPLLEPEVYRACAAAKDQIPSRVFSQSDEIRTARHRKRRKDVCGFRAAHRPETIYLESQIVDGSFAAKQLAAEYP